MHLWRRWGAGAGAADAGGGGERADWEDRTDKGDCYGHGDRDAKWNVGESVHWDDLLMCIFSMYIYSDADIAVRRETASRTCI